MDSNTSLAIVALLIMEAVKSQGFTPPEVLNKSGNRLSLDDLKAAYLADEYLRLPNESIDRLFVESRLKTGSTLLGFYAADKLQPAMLKGLGFSWLASQTLKDGIERLVLFSSLISDRVYFDMHSDKDIFQITIEAHEPSPPVEVIQMAAGVLLRMCGLAANKEIQPLKAYTSQKGLSEEEIDTIKNIIGCEIVLQSTGYRIDFSRAELLQPLLSYNKRITNIFDVGLFQQLSASKEQPYTSRVVRLILNLMESGEVSQDEVASRLNITVKTLQRKLSGEGAKFSQLLRDTREKLAKIYLLNGKYSIKKTAFLLGYKEETSFIKAFKTWTGTSPGNFIEQELL